MPSTSELVNEYQHLIAECGTYYRLPDGWPVEEYAEAKNQQRLARLDNLAAMLNNSQSVHYDPVADIKRWVERNPVALSTAGLRRILDEIDAMPGHPQMALSVMVGGPSARDADGSGKSGAFYVAVEGDLVVDGSRGLCLQVPEAIAEQLRQQGRRALRREFNNLIVE